jgi:uncharacterized protein YegJ (DUF2314 family)
MRTFVLPALLVVLVTAGSAPAPAQTVLQRAERDELFLVPNEDPQMAAAMRKARATLKDFLALAKKPGEKMEGFAVKVAVHDKGRGEYFWILPFEQKGDRFTGAINNTPRSVRNVTNGQTISFSESEIADWMYMDNGQMKGNYTACALLAREPKAQAEAFKKRFGLDCGS